MAEGIAHLAGACLTVEGRYMRQRCAWCGAVLIDHDLSLVQTVGGRPPAQWAAGAWVEIGDGFGMVVTPEDGRFPENSCISIEYPRAPVVRLVAANGKLEGET